MKSPRKGLAKGSARPPKVDTGKNRRQEMHFKLSDSEHVSPVRGRELSGIRTGRFSVVEEGYDWMLRAWNVPIAGSPDKQEKKKLGWSSTVEPIKEADRTSTHQSRQKQSRRLSLSQDIKTR